MNIVQLSSLTYFFFLFFFFPRNILWSLMNVAKDSQIKCCIKPGKLTPVRMSLRRADISPFSAPLGWTLMGQALKGIFKSLKVYRKK